VQTLFCKPDIKEEMEETIFHWREQSFMEHLKGCITGILLAFCQNVAKIMIKCLRAHKKRSWDIKRNISRKLLQGLQTIISFSIIFASYWPRAVENV